MRIVVIASLCVVQVESLKVFKIIISDPCTKGMRVMKYHCFFLEHNMKMRAVSLREEIETGARVG